MTSTFRALQSPRVKFRCCIDIPKITIRLKVFSQALWRHQARKNKITAIFFVNACWYFARIFFGFRLNGTIFSRACPESSLLYIFATNRTLKVFIIFSRAFVDACPRFDSYLCPRGPLSPMSLANINTSFN